MPWGYKTLGQVSWTPSLGVEALRKNVVRPRPPKKRKGKERGWERENWWLLISWVQSPKSLYLLWFLYPGFPQSFQWVSLFLEARWSWAPLNFDSDLVLDPSLPDTNRGTHLFQHHYEWNPLFLTENRVCRPPNTVHQHPGQECPKCEWVCVGSSLTDFWITPWVYTACARPTLSFPRSKTEKYTLRKTSPRAQVSVDVFTRLPWKPIKQSLLDSWGS